MRIKLEQIFPYILNQYCDLKAEFFDSPMTVADVNCNDTDRISTICRTNFHNARMAKLDFVKSEIKQRQNFISGNKQRVIRDIFYFKFQTTENSLGLYRFKFDCWIRDKRIEEHFDAKGIRMVGDETQYKRNLEAGISNPTVTDYWNEKCKFFELEQILCASATGDGWFLPETMESVRDQENSDNGVLGKFIERVEMFDETTKKVVNLSYKEALEVAHTADDDFEQIKVYSDDLWELKKQQNLLEVMESEQKSILYLLEEAEKTGKYCNIANSFSKKIDKIMN